jgi:CheY-like chemotaxis protein
MRDRPLILIVDDEPFNVDYLEQELEDLEYDTVSAMDGVEALQQVAAANPDMILLDIMMPVMDGFETLDRLKANEAWRDIPVVIISAMSDINSIARGIEAGAEDYLPKPFDPTLLEARLHAGLEKKRLRDQEIEYLHQVEYLTGAAEAIEENAFSPRSLDPVVAREDALGNLGRVFLRMAEEVHQREQRLQQQVAQLQLDMAERRDAAAETAVIYLPIDRRQALVAGRELPSRAQGAALFADVSGFTPLTEALVEELGRQRGAEELVRQLNRVFTTLVAEVHAYRGSVIGFSGDAITCWFDEDTGAAQTPGAQLRALACALALQEAIRSFAELTTSGGQLYSVGIKVAVAAGSVRRFLPGNPDLQVMETLAGRVLDTVALGEQLAQRGEVIAAQELANALGEQVLRGVVRGDGELFSVVEGLLAEIPQTPWPDLPPDALSPEQARPWLLSAVFDQVSAGQSDFLSQLRPISALFLHFAGIDYDIDQEAGEQLDRFVRRVQETLREQDGQILNLTIGDKGNYFYAVFGAPLALEDDAARAVATALQLRQLPDEFDFISGVRLGLTRGLMRSGAYGSNTRRTYGAIGDATNMAARLMMAGVDGDILVDESIYEYAQAQFEFEALAPIMVKGREEPLNVYRPMGPRSRAALRRELDQLSPLLQTMVKTASILSRSFEAKWLAALCGDSSAREQAPDLLNNLAEIGMLEVEDGHFHFADPLLRETAYETMLFAQRRQLHRAAAEWLEKSYEADLSPYYEDLAYHWEHAEDTARTIRYLELAAAQAREKGDLETALALYDKTLALQTAA